MCSVKSVNSNVMVGKWLIKMFKTQFNVFSMFQVYVSSCIFLPVSLLLPW